MKVENQKNKIQEVMAHARVVVQEFGHTKKFAKHIVALAIKQLEGLTTDDKLLEFISTDPIGKEIGYEHRPCPSIFSKVRERSDPEMIRSLITGITAAKYRHVVVAAVVEDSTDIDAYSRKDRDARWGKRTVPKKRQSVKSEKVENFFGYKLHGTADADSDIPLSIEVVSGNRNDKVLFPHLFVSTKENFRLQLDGKFIADAQYSSYKIRRELRSNELTPVIPISGNKYMKTEEPKDPDYRKRWSIERIFSRLKEMFNMAKNRLIGLKKVRMHVYSCVLAYLIEYLL